jgi:hypothetical protein
MNQAEPNDALKRLEAFIGEWSMELGLSSPSPIDGRARSVFEWVLGAQFLVQRSEVPDHKAPNSIAIVAYDRERDAYRQQYFDSRGVVRVYAMTFDGGTWTLLRDAPDFTPLDFFQRFLGTFSDDGRTIRGTWEKSSDGVRWVRDFDLTYSKV